MKLSQQYDAAFRRHLKQGPRASLQPALELGHQTMLLGLEAPDLVRMHMQAIATLKLENRTNRVTRRAGILLTEALVPFVGTHGPSRWEEVPGDGGLKMAARTPQSRRRVVRHKCTEASMKNRSEDCTVQSKGALPKQESSRQLAHRILLAQECERRKFSHPLHDEITQTLPSTDFRLLNVIEAAKGKWLIMATETIRTQPLLEASVKSLNHFAPELASQNSA